jgi:hypothetical protein
MDDFLRYNFGTLLNLIISKRYFNYSITHHSFYRIGIEEVRYERKNAISNE